jgi:hypothetical protein
VPNQFFGLRRRPAAKVSQKLEKTLRNCTEMSKGMTTYQSGPRKSILDTYNMNGLIESSLSFMPKHDDQAERSTPSIPLSLSGAAYVYLADRVRQQSSQPAPKSIRTTNWRRNSTTDHLLSPPLRYFHNNRLRQTIILPVSDNIQCFLPGKVQHKN